MGGFRVGDHHDSYLFEPKTGWTIFCIVRPHHEVIASLIYRSRGPHIEDYGAWETAYQAFLDTYCRNETLYWRTAYCSQVLKYPDVRIPVINVKSPVVGETGHGERWQEIVPEHILNHMRESKVIQSEYERYGWEMP